MINPGVVICAVGGDDKASIDIAKGYIAERGFTSDDVRLVKGEGVIMVVTKKRMEDLK